MASEVVESSENIPPDSHREDQDNEQHHHMTESDGKLSQGHNTEDVKSITIFKNGDEFNQGKRIVLNPRQIRTWDSFLETLTTKLKPTTGAIRDICTPSGGRRVENFDDLQNQGKYVAVPAREKIKFIDYLHQDQRPRRRKNPNGVRLDPILPVSHSSIKADSRIHLELAKHRKVPIFIYRNGDEYTRAICIMLTPLQHEDMERIMRAIAERVVLPGNKPIRRLYTMEGHFVRHIEEIEEGKYFVAAAHEVFIPKNYGQVVPRIVLGKSNKSKVVAGKYENIHYLSKLPTPPQSRTRSKPSTIGSTPRTSGEPREPQSRRYPSHGEEDINGPLPYIGRSPRHHYQSPTRPVRAASEESPREKNIRRPHPPTENGIRERKSSINGPERGRKPDPKVRQNQEAATIIQAAAKGHLSRKDSVKGRKPEKDDKPVPQTNGIPQKKEKPKEEPPKKEIVKADARKSPTRKQSTKNNDETEKAATRIQASYKGYKTRKDLVKKTTKPDQMPEQEQAAKRIQAGYRGYKTRKSLLPKNEKDNECEEAATRIQASFKGYRTRKELATKKAITPVDENKEKAASRIQAGFKGYRTRKELVSKKSRSPEDEEMDKAASRIQAGFKGYQTRKKLVSTESKSPDDKEKDKAASKIQAGFKGYQTRKKLVSKESKSPEDTEKDKAASRIQAGFKGYQTRKALVSKQAKDKKTEKAATRIQAGYRGYRTRRDLSRKDKSDHKEANDEKTEKAATKIQAGYRGYRTRRDLPRKDKSDHKETNDEAAATRIQASYRGYQTRKELAARNLPSGKDEEENAATRIQASYRGYRTRRDLTKGSDDSETATTKAATTIQASYRGYATRKAIGKRSTKEPTPSS